MEPFADVIVAAREQGEDILSNITLFLQKFPWALPSGTSSGKGLYLTVYPSSHPNTDRILSDCEFQVIGGELDLLIFSEASQNKVF